MVVRVVADRLQLHPCAEVHPHHSQLAAAEQEGEEGEARAVAGRRVANQVVVVGQHPRETEETEIEIETNTIVMGSRSRLVAAAVTGQQEEEQEEEEAQHLPGAGVGS